MLINHPIGHSTREMPNQFDVQNVSLGDLWLNETNQNVWVLVSLAGDMMSKGSLATWTKIDNAGGTGILDTLTGDTGGAIDPDINSNINLLSGIVGFTFDGDPLTNTITLNSTGGSGDVVQTVVTDAGTAAPVLGVLNLNAGNVSQNAGSTVLFTGSVNTVELDVTDGSSNTIIGAGSGNATLSGSKNTALGQNAGTSLTTGSNNTFIGQENGNSVSTGSSNTLVGQHNGSSITSGEFNTIVGSGAGDSFTTGSFNTLLGIGVGSAYTSNESDNVIINSPGVIGDSNTLRIGDGTGGGALELNRAFICGIDGVNVGSVARVVTEASNQLGTAVITAGSGITITPSANAITIATVGGASGPSFFAYMTNTVSNVTGSGEVYQIIYDTTISNLGGAFNPGTGVFTAPAAGLYNFSIGILCECGTYQVQQPLYANLVTTTRTFAMIVGIGFSTGSTLQRADVAN